MPATPYMINLLAILVLTGIALVWDLRWRRIPNWLTVTALALAFVTQVAFAGAPGFLFAFKGFAAGFGIMLVLWFIGGGGGGDVKLMAALGAWLGAVGVAIVLLGSVVISILITLGLVAWRMVAPARPALAGSGAQATVALTRRSWSRITIPFALPSCLATWLYVTLKLLAAFGHSAT